MPLKAVASTILGLSLGNDINIAEISEQDLQMVTIGQLREVVE